MYNSTDTATVDHGTSISEMPSRVTTIGAKATSMIRSFTATCTKVYPASPRTSRLHTNTIAVHGAAPSKIAPAR